MLGIGIMVTLEPGVTIVTVTEKFGVFFIMLFEFESTKIFQHLYPVQNFVLFIMQYEP